MGRHLRWYNTKKETFVISYVGKNMNGRGRGKMKQKMHVYMCRKILTIVGSSTLDSSKPMQPLQHNMEVKNHLDLD